MYAGVKVLMLLLLLLLFVVVVVVTVVAAAVAATVAAVVMVGASQTSWNLTPTRPVISFSSKTNLLCFQYKLCDSCITRKCTSTLWFQT